jgi:UDP-N-acetylglucosamine 2-epimerase (non-hydrolysing)
MSALRVLAVGGCRPNFVKLAPLFAEMRRHADLEPLLVHTGQHYDRALSQVFFEELGLPAPDVALAVGSGSHGAQTARLIEGMETVLREQLPDLVLVVGDVNSTLAGALAAVKLGFPVAHVEAGLRSGDREMPEEINRVLTDAVSDLLFATEASAVANLRAEGIAADRIHLVGNVMVDALRANLGKLGTAAAREAPWPARPYALLTLHRPENVDDAEILARILAAAGRLARRLPVLFPVHPRTRRALAAAGHGSGQAAGGVEALPPLGYLEFLALMRDAALVLTDSGGVQEETTALGVPCLTLRQTTERPATVEAGTNRVVGTDPDAIVAAALAALDGEERPARLPALWDGAAAGRIVAVLRREAGALKDLHRALRTRNGCSRQRREAAA